MNYKVFFAFQMDIEDKYGKGFICSALDITIDKFLKEGIKVELDYGFRGTPGTPLLIDTMLNKSDGADMVIVDLTFTSAREWLDAEIVDEDDQVKWISIPKVDRKPSPNPNVLLETGFAWAKKGTFRTLVVMNEAFGSPKFMPVDMIGFRWGITYNLNSKNYEVRKTERSNLAENLYRAIKESINSEANHQRERLTPLKIYQDWKSEDFKYPFKLIRELKEIIIKLRKALDKPGNPQRLIGPKNTGKTRLAHELFTEIDSSLPKTSSLEKIVYYDLAESAYHSIESKILHLVLLNQDKVLIIDNCPNSIHNRICSEAIGSNLRILTISEENKDKVNIATIQITEEIAKKIIASAVKEKYTGANASAIMQLAHGNVREALFYTYSTYEYDEALETNYLNKWKQLLGHEKISSGAIDLLEVISIFSRIGVSGNYRGQIEFIIEKLNKIPKDEFEKLIQFFIEKGMIKRVGDFIILEAFIEEFANNWWKNKYNSYSETFFEDIAKVKLSKQLGERLIDLLKGTEDSDVIKIITGNESVNYDFVNTEQGSQLIKNLAEVAPIEIMRILDKIFEGKTVEDLYKFENGRRNIVWALEKLCFREITFKPATILLFKLALAENEEIGNNATAQFLQLFQPLLAGTEVDLKTRLNLLIELYGKNG
jgi:hypothetical protein